jgi:hypothetical protein|tara:strand:- start:3335 stop:3739 length:405 start_codon:yes stop_codon:yes gene_type:complete
MTEQDYDIFDGKTFKDLTKDIYRNAKNKKNQIEVLIKEIHNFISNIDEAVIVAPIIKELMDVSVKNDEHLIKLASVLQRIIVKSADGRDDDLLTLSEHEKEELLQVLQETANEVQKKSDEINIIKEKNNKILEI